MELPAYVFSRLKQKRRNLPEKQQSTVEVVEQCRFGPQDYFPRKLLDSGAMSIMHELNSQPEEENDARISLVAVNKGIKSNSTMEKKYYAVHCIYLAYIINAKEE